MKKKVLILDEVHPVLTDMLQAKGYQCDTDMVSGESVVREMIGDYHGLIVRSRMRIDREMISKAAQLKFIGRVGAGMEGIDRDFAESMGIFCLNAPEGNRDSVAEHAVGMLLCLMNQILKADQEVRSGKWDRKSNRGHELMGKTVGIIGYGNTGSAFAKRLSGFDAGVIAYDKYKTGFSDGIVSEADMDTIFRETDVLSLHIPLNGETRDLVDMDFIMRFHKPFILINTSRGQIVKTYDLVNAMQQGKISGAALDVLEYESGSFENFDKPKFMDAFHYLSQSEKVIFTPHVAGWTHESNYKLAKVMAEKILELGENL